MTSDYPLRRMYPTLRNGPAERLLEPGIANSPSISDLNGLFRTKLEGALLAGNRRTVVSKRHSPEELLHIFQNAEHVYTDMDNTCVREGEKKLSQSLLRKMRLLRTVANVDTQFVTGRPWSELEEIVGELDNGDCPEIIFERGAFILARQPDGTMQIQDYLVTPEMKEEATQVREKFTALHQALEQHYGVRIVPAGTKREGGHRVVLSIDILRRDIADNYEDYPRSEMKVPVQQSADLLKNITGDIDQFLQMHFPEWKVVDLGNANFEITPKMLTKRNAIVREHSLIFGDSRNDLDAFNLNERPDIHAGVVYHEMTPTDLIDQADFGTSGIANAEVFFDKLIQAKHLMQQVQIASNTPPYELKHDNSLGLKIGMPVALANLVGQMDARNCRWVYVGDDDFRDHKHGLQGKLIPVPITKAERAGHYRAVSNETYWPVAHKPHVQTPVGKPTDEEWMNYDEVCHKIAAAIHRSLGKTQEGNRQPGRIIWVQDYQMIGVAEQLIAQRPEHDYTLALYWHIPLPPAEVLRAELGDERAAAMLRQLSSYQLLGFHTQNYESNYREACDVLGITPTRTLVKPISVNVEEISSIAHEVQEKGHVFERKDLNSIIDIEAIRTNPAERERYVLAGMERCDDTKACIERLEAWKLIAQMQPELLKDKRIIEVIVPSRQEIPYYKALYDRVHVLVHEINTLLGEHTIFHIDKIDSRKDVIAAMHLCNTFIATPQADGFNMAAAEAAVVQMLRGSGSLVLSQRIGFCQSLHEHGLADAVVSTNEITPEGIARALVDSLSGINTLSPERFEKLKQYFTIHNLQTWTQDNIRAALEAAFLDEVVQVDMTQAA